MELRRNEKITFRCTELEKDALAEQASDEESADRWFKCKLIFITLDEKSGAEKKTSTQVLVQAADLRDVCGHCHTCSKANDWLYTHYQRGDIHP